MRSRNWKRALVLTALALISAPRAGTAGEYYFGIIFGSQSHPKLLKYCHTWATFIRLVGEGPDLSTYQIYSHTISWYPADRSVEVWRLSPEPGANLTLDQTFQTVLAHKQRIRAWGPFQIQAETYNKSVWVYNVLASGQAQYQAISSQYDLLIADCIHAVAAVDPQFGRDHYPLIRVGIPASRYIARQVVQRSPIDQSKVHAEWLFARLGLTRYPVEYVSNGDIPPRPCVMCMVPEEHALSGKGSRP